MGVCINKCIGYGLVDICDGDHRLNGTMSEIFKRAYTMTGREFAKYAHTMRFGTLNYIPTIMEFKLARSEVEFLDADMSRWIISESEGGLDNVLIFIPPGQDHWHRHDDIIDYVESVYLHSDDLSPTIEELDAGIYPYCNRMDARTGADVQLIPMFLDMFKLIKDKPDDCVIDRDLKDFLKLPFNTFGELKQYYKPRIPWDITVMCRFLKIFRDDNTLKQLRPYLYTYWS